MTTAVSQGLDTWLAAFDRSVRRPGGAAPEWLVALRREAMTRFSETGFPTTRDEDWRRTSVAPIARTAFLPAVEAAPVTAPTEARIERLAPSAGARRLVFLDGRLVPELSRTAALPPGVTFTGLAAVLAAGNMDDLIRTHLGRYAIAAEGRSGAFTRLNTALFADGALLHLPEGIILEGPVHLIFVATGRQGAAVVSHPRVLIVMDRGSQATVVETYTGIGEGAGMTNAVTEIAAAEGTVLDHYRIQREGAEAFHIGRQQASLGRSASYATCSITLGAALTRNESAAVLAAEGIDCTLNGLTITTGTQHADNQTVIDHASPRCASRELYKGVLDGRSRTVFNGRIIVRPDACKTDSRQTNRNLVLSEEALVDTKPELQIHNNDVKCSHAAAIGQLDEAAMFYLRSRGLGREEARSLLTHAFVSDIVGRIKVAPLRDALEDLLLARLPGYQGVREAAL